ncbi:MAG: divalent-cation tolerance protein CutA [Candidatus Altimarinota bacterium]
MKYCSIFIPCKDKKEALKIAKALLEERLVVCANMIPGVESMFWWEGTIQKASEVLLLMKTKHSLVSKVMKRVKALHSYECPVMEVFEMKDGNPEFLQWIEETIA